MPIYEIHQAPRGVVDQNPRNPQGDLKKLERACQEFEAILIHHLLKTMRQTIPRSGLFETGREREIYQSLFDEEISKAISKRRDGLGLGKVLYQELTKGGGYPLRKEVHPQNGGLEERGRYPLSPSRSGSHILPSADWGREGRGQVSEVRQHRGLDSDGQGD